MAFLYFQKRWFEGNLKTSFTVWTINIRIPCYSVFAVKITICLGYFSVVIFLHMK